MNLNQDKFLPYALPEISEEEIVKLEIATGEPIFYEFNEKKLQRKLNW